MSTSSNLIQHDFSILPKSIMPANSYLNITVNLLIIILIIILLFVISYYIINIIDKYSSLIFFIPQSEKNIKLKPIVQPESELIKPESELIKPDIIITTETNYKKYDEIVLPSSISGTSGYIGRDYICYKNKANDIDFISKRPKCMVCQTDPNNNNYDNTNTNIISTCVYTDNIQNNDPMVWNKNMCINKCSVI